MNLFEIANALISIPIVIAVGFVLSRREFLSTDVWSGLNRLTYWVGLPSLLLMNIWTATFELGKARGPLQVMVAITLITALVAYLMRYLIEMPEQTKGAFVQAAFRSNLAYIGFPVVFYGIGSVASEETAASMRTMAVLLVAPVVPLYNLLAVFALAGMDGDEKHSLWTRLKGPLRSVITNPLLLACLGGLLLNSLAVPCPVFVERSLTLLGDFALPLALLGIGASLARSRLKGHLGVPLIATAFKLGVMVLLAHCFCQLFNVRGVQQTLVLLLAACPTAIASYVMAHELGSDAEFTSRTIVLSTVLCFPVFVLILLFS